MKSAAKSVSCGVPQGSILGPLLVTLQINDIDLQLNHCEIILYADDTIIYCAPKTGDNIESQLNTDIDQVADWLAKNNLVANLKRTKTDPNVSYSEQDREHRNQHHMRSDERTKYH